MTYFGCEFWLDDVAALDDFTRIFIFGLTFFYCNCLCRHSPISLSTNYAKKTPIWIYNDDSNSYLFRYIIYPSIYIINKLFNTTTITLIKWTQIICKISWISVVIGFGGITTMIILFISIFILVGLQTTIKAMTHKYYCLFLTFGSLCFTAQNRSTYSFDYYLFNNHNANTTIHSTGFGLKLATIFLVYSLFSAGICKLKNLEWLNGESLYFYIYGSSVNSKCRKRYLPQILKKHKYFFTLLSVLSVVLELFAICLLFVYALDINYSYKLTFKVIIILSFIGFHVGIRLFMNPNYTLQSILYIVAIPFSSFYNSEHITSHCDHLENENMFKYYILFGNGMVVLLIVVMIFSIESYPFSIFPMYSSLRKILETSNISKEIIFKYFEMKKRQTNPMFSTVYHFNGNWFKILLLIYDRYDNHKLLHEINILKKKNICGLLATRRRNDAIFELYLNNKLQFPMILCDGYFMESDKIEQYKYMNISNFGVDKKLKYIEKYLIGLMQKLQKKSNTFCTYDVYPRFVDKELNKKGCYYQFKLDLNTKEVV